MSKESGPPRSEFRRKGEGPKGPAGPTDWMDRCPVLWCKEGAAKPLEEKIGELLDQAGMSEWGTWLWPQLKVYVRLHSRWLLEHQGVAACQCSS